MVNQTALRLTKLLDISLLGIYYLLGALVLVSLFNGLSKRLFNNKKYPIEKVKTITLLFQVCLQVTTICIMGYFLRHIVRSIPFAFEGNYGYHHTKTKEINGGIVIAFGLITAFSDFKDRTVELSKRLSF